MVLYLLDLHVSVRNFQRNTKKFQFISIDGLIEII